MEEFSVEKHMREVVEKAGGSFKVTSLLQKRIRALNQGAQKLVDIDSRNLFDIAFAELNEGKIEMKEQDPEKKNKSMSMSKSKSTSTSKSKSKSTSKSKSKSKSKGKSR